jgi:hypothetical protein
MQDALELSAFSAKTAPLSADGKDDFLASSQEAVQL